MLVTLGNTLAGLKMHHFTTSIFLGKPAHPVLGFGVAYCVAWAFDLEGVARGVLILQGVDAGSRFHLFLCSAFRSLAR